MTEESLAYAEEKLSEAYDVLNQIQDEEVRDRLRTGIDSVAVLLTAAQYKDEIGLFEKGDAVDYGTAGVTELAKAYEDAQELIEAGADFGMTSVQASEAVDNILSSVSENPAHYSEETIEEIDDAEEALRSTGETLQNTESMMRDATTGQEVSEYGAQIFINSLDALTQDDPNIERRFNSSDEIKMAAGAAMGITNQEQ